jgi:hypothetical protein
MFTITTGAHFIVMRISIYILRDISYILYKKYVLLSQVISSLNGVFDLENCCIVTFSKQHVRVLMDYSYLYNDTDDAEKCIVHIYVEKERYYIRGTNEYKLQRVQIILTFNKNRSSLPYKKMKNKKKHFLTETQKILFFLLIIKLTAQLLNKIFIEIEVSFAQIRE